LCTAPDLRSRRMTTARSPRSTWGEALVTVSFAVHPASRNPASRTAAHVVWSSIIAPCIRPDVSTVALAFTCLAARAKACRWCRQSA